MTDEQTAAIIAEIAALTECQYMQPGDITIREYMTAMRVSRGVARRQIERAVEQGVLIDLGQLINPANGRWMRAYRRADGHPN